MILIGLLLIIVAAGSGVWLVLATQSVTTQVEMTAMGVTIRVAPLALLIAGAVVLLLLLAGLALIRAGVRLRRRPSRDAKNAQRQAELEENIRADERARAEESHQAALADRDRVREDEFVSRQSLRDQEREAEYRNRQVDDEQRIRADERARVEQEFRARERATAGGAPVPSAGEPTTTLGGPASTATTSGAGSAAAPAASGIAGAAVGPSPGRRAAAASEPDLATSRAETPSGHDAGDYDHGRGGLTDEPATAADGEAGDTDGDRGLGEDPAESADGDPEAAARHRTVADRIMGRD